MREYFPKHSQIPKDVYEQVKDIMRGYDRLKRERVDITYGSGHPADGMPRDGGPGNPTEQRAIKLSYINDRLEAIDQTAIELLGWLGGKVNDDFDPVRAFWNYDYYNYQHIRRGESDEGPVRKTWTRYRYRFAAGVAKRLNIF